MKRRDFLKSTAALAGSISLPAWSLAQSRSAEPATLHIHFDKTIGAVDPGFIGLSYETAQLKSPDFFSSSNKQLVALFRALSVHGVLRLGGDTSDYAVMDDAAPAAGVQSTQEAVGPDKGAKHPTPANITQASLQNLRGFLDATGWRCLFGLNLGKNTPEQTAEQAVEVTRILGNTLLAFQIGNEADLYRTNDLRRGDYGYDDFIKEWQPMFHAVRNRLPDAQFAGPDLAGTSRWIGDFARQFGEDVMLLTSHYYAECPPTDPAMTIERLLSPQNPRFIGAHIPAIQAAMAVSHLPYRLAETNSCCHGGKAGVSDTFASALWAGDLMLQIASAGATGINFHGGGDGLYTPIAGSLKNGFTPRPEYYGIFMVSKMLGSSLIDCDLDAVGMDGLLTTYAAKSAEGKHQLAIFNKHENKDATLAFAVPASVKSISVLRLAAARLEETQDITFGGAPIAPDGQWTAAKSEKNKPIHGKIDCIVPRGSAALLEWI